MAPACQVLMRFGDECGRPGHEGHDECIFHFEGLKDPEEFEHAFLNLLEEYREQKEHLDFTRFVFPDFRLEGETFDEPVYLRQATFVGDWKLYDVEFREKADFIEVSAESRRGSIDFAGVTFEKQAQFTRSEFDGITTFSATFEGYAGFGDGYFDYVDFAQTEFRHERGLTTFSGREFRDLAGFGGVEFHGPVDFRGCEFTNRRTSAFFAGADFYDEARFTRAEFHGTGVFRNTTWHSAHQEVNFVHAQFHQGGWFNQAAFGGPTVFRNAEFGIRVDEQEADGDGQGAQAAGATFRNLEIDEMAGDFSGSHFHTAATFGGAVFHTQCLFVEADFEGRVSFNGVDFHGPAAFINVDFGQETVFRGATSHTLLSFSGAAFSRRSIFEDLVLLNPEDGTGVGLDFSRVSLPLDRAVLFIGKSATIEAASTLDLSHARFALTDTSRIRFVNVGFGKESKVIDERFLRRPGEDPEEPDGVLEEDFQVDFPHLVELYRGLRRSYESDLRFPEGGEFHIREMEARLENEAWSECSGIRRGRKLVSLLFWYGKLSRYGESPKRALAVFFAFTVIGTVFFWANRLEKRARAFFADLPPQGLWEAVLATLNLILPSQIEASSLSGMFFGALGFVLFGLLLLSLRRRFKRF